MTATMLARYLLHVVESRVQGSWANKAAYESCVILGSEALKLLLLLVFEALHIFA